MNSTARKFINLFILILVFGTLFYYKSEITSFVRNIISDYKPCVEPITYTIGTFDTKFGISQKDFLAITANAEKIWESSTVANGKELFKYEPDASKAQIKINLIYDSRQQATEKLRSLGYVIGNDKKSYDELKVKYNALVATYDARKLALTKTIAKFEAEKEAYEKEVAYWNSHGGANPQKYKELQDEKGNLDAQVNAINKTQSELNDMTDTINDLANELNKLASELNLQVKVYNTTGASNGEEFDEGEYVQNGNERTINIYQFDDKSKLLRVLAHELGHALGLPHVEDKKAIMYRLNQSLNEKLTADDINALKAVCGVK